MSEQESKLFISSDAASELAQMLNTMPVVGFDSKGQYNRYASLKTVMESIKPHMDKHGFAVMQPPVTGEGEVGVRTILMHKSGEAIDLGTLCLPLDKATAQAGGSAMTYVRRYALCSALGIVADEDDDGQSATSAASSSKSQSNSEPANGKAPARSAQSIDQL